MFRSATHARSPLFWPRHLLLLIGLPGLVALVGCEPTPTAKPATTAPVAAVDLNPDPQLTALTQQLWQQGGGLLERANSQAIALNQAVATLLADPSESQLAAARDAWRLAHRDWRAFGPLLMLGVNNPGLFNSLEQWQFAIDAWPIQPGFLDYFAGYEQSGIVNDLALPIAAAELRQQHGLTDISDVAIGFHAIEYLLWGEAKGLQPGQRPVADYLPGTSISQAQQIAGLRVIDLPTNRRRDLLRLLCQLLVDDLAAMQKQWNDPNGTLHTSYSELQGQSRAQLLANASAAWLQAEQAQLKRIATPPAGDIVEVPEWHNAFSGSANSELAEGLTTLETLFLKPDTSLGPWLMPSANQQRLAADMLALRTQLTTANTTLKGKPLDAALAKLSALESALSASGNTGPDSTDPGIEPSSSGD